MDKRSHDERAKNGLQTRREVLGADYVDKAMTSVDGFSEEFTELLNTYCWNDIWNRPGLPRKYRSVLNLGMLVGLLPITGLTLPLVSYGGSSLLANSLALGLVLNVGLRPGYEVTNEPFRFVD